MDVISTQPGPVVMGVDPLDCARKVAYPGVALDRELAGDERGRATVAFAPGPVVVSMPATVRGEPVPTARSVGVTGLAAMATAVLGLVLTALVLIWAVAAVVLIGVVAVLGRAARVVRR